MFVRGVHVGCKKRVGDFQTGASWRCDCAGFRPITGELSQASFAAPDPDPEEAIPPLRAARPRRGCFEDVRAGEFCHRRVLADWLEQATAGRVPELGVDEPGADIDRLSSA